MKNMHRLNIAIDADVFSDAKDALQNMGLTPTRAIVLFFLYVARERKLPFAISSNEGDAR